MAQYYIKRTINQIDNTQYYVRLSQKQFHKTNITFNTYGSILDIVYDFWLDGAYAIPINSLLMNIDSEIGTFQNLTAINVEELSNSYHNYRVCLRINTDLISSLKGDIFNKKINFIASLAVDKNIFNNANLSTNAECFINDLNKIQIVGEIAFSNFFPIEKLSEHYISNQYKTIYDTLNVLPNDFFSWVSNKNIVFPEFYFIKNIQTINLKYTTLNKLYQTNIKDASFINSFDNASIKLNYTINGINKSLDLNLKQFNLANENTNDLWLNVRTIYNFEKQELTQSMIGVNGIYFPITVGGELEVKLTKNKKTYKDTIPFNFSNNFYSQSNPNLNVQIGTFTEESGSWKEVIYA